MGGSARPDILDSTVGDDPCSSINILACRACAGAARDISWTVRSLFAILLESDGVSDLFASSERRDQSFVLLSLEIRALAFFNSTIFRNQVSHLRRAPLHERRKLQGIRIARPLLNVAGASQLDKYSMRISCDPGIQSSTKLLVDLLKHVAPFMSADTFGSLVYLREIQQDLIFSTGEPVVESLEPKNFRYDIESPAGLIGVSVGMRCGFHVTSGVRWRYRRK